MTESTDKEVAAFGRGLALTNGDLSFDNGELTLVEGRENLWQGLQMMIETPFGSDVFNVEYGFDWTGVFTLPNTVGMAQDLIRLNLVKSVSQDNRIREIKDIAFDNDPHFFELTAVKSRKDSRLEEGDLEVTSLEESKLIHRQFRRWQAVVVLTTILNTDEAVKLDGTGI